MLVALLLASSPLVSFPCARPAQAAVERLDERLPVVVVPRGDASLRDTLALAGELWHDAGEFLVGALDGEAIAALRQRGVALSTMASLAQDDELVIVRAARHDFGGVVRHRAGEFLLVSVPAGRIEPDECLGHDDPARIRRRPMPRAAPPPLAAASPGGGAQALLSHDLRIQALVDQVSKSNLQASVQSYSAFTNRDSMNLANFGAARAQLVAQLQGWGYQPILHTWNASHGPNIRVEIPGTRSPGEWVVIGAHFDTRNYSGGVNAVAPGADDNTSGSAGVLEIARILAGAQAFENPIRLMWFSGEEYGLYGSGADAQLMAGSGLRVAGMLNMDMIAYRASGDPRDCDFVTNNASAALIAFCQQTAPLYVANWASTSGSLSGGSSDHASYTQAGFPAAFFFEDASSYSPYIHGANDVHPTSTNDYDLAEMIVKGALASAAALAEPADLSIVHSELPDTTNASGPYPVQATITSLYGSTVTGATLRYRVRGSMTWTAAAMAPSGATWSASIPSFGSPLVIEYYLEAVDHLGALEYAPEGVDAGADPYDFFVGTRNVVYATGFEEASDNGWTHGLIANQDDWQRGDPAGTSGDPAAPFAGAKAWGNDIGGPGWNGAYANNVHNYLRSPPIDCSGAANVHLEFRRWLTVESGQYDQARIRVAGQLVWSNPASGNLIDDEWRPITIDVSSVAAGNPSVQVEFSLQSDGGVAFGGWNVDELALVELGPGTVTCPSPASYCTAKTNSLGCAATIAWTGTPSASSGAPFLVSASQALNQRSGLLFYGFAPAALPFQGGTKCVANPLRRTALQGSGGNPGAPDCSGVFAFDFNAWTASGVDPALVAGADVFAQWWYRDGGDPFGTALSDALQFRICP